MNEERVTLRLMERMKSMEAEKHAYASKLERKLARHQRISPRPPGQRQLTPSLRIKSQPLFCALRPAM